MPETIAARRLLAFHGSPEIKAKYLARVEKHRKADQIVQRYYWQGGKGCAVGCTLHGDRHKDYETELGIPEHLAYLEDAIFEGLPIEQARAWPGRFLAAPAVGADLSLVFPRFTHWLLTSPEIGLLRIADDAGKSAIATVAELYCREIDGDIPSPQDWAAAWAASDAASDASDASDAMAASDASDAMAASDASDAAWAASDAASDAAWAASDAASDASDAARAARAAARAAAGDATWAATWAATWKIMAEQLLSLMASAPIPEVVR